MGQLHRSSNIIASAPILWEWSWGRCFINPILVVDLSDVCNTKSHKENCGIGKLLMQSDEASAPGLDVGFFKLFPILGKGLVFVRLGVLTSWGEWAVSVLRPPGCRASDRSVDLVSKQHSRDQGQWKFWTDRDSLYLWGMRLSARLSILGLCHSTSR